MLYVFYKGQMMKLKSLMIFLTTNISINAVNEDAFKLVKTFNISTKDAQNRLNANADRVNNNLKNERKKIADGLVQILVSLDARQAHVMINKDDVSKVEPKDTKENFLYNFSFLNPLNILRSKKDQKNQTQKSKIADEVITRNINYYNSIMQNLQEKYKITPLLCAIALKSEGINLDESAIKKYFEFLDLFFVEYCDILTNFDIKYLFAVSVARIFSNKDLDFVWFKKDKDDHLMIDNLIHWFKRWYTDCKKNSKSNLQLLAKFDNSIRKCQEWRLAKKELNKGSLQVAYTDLLTDLLNSIVVSQDMKNEIINIIDNQSKSDLSNHILQMLIIYELINGIPVKSLDNESFDKMFNKMIKIKAMEAEADQKKIDNLKLVKRPFKSSKANANEDHNSEAYSVADSSSWNSSEITSLEGSDFSSND